MSLKKVWKNIILLVIILAITPLIILLLIRLVPKPPVSEVENARLTLSKAVSGNAATYSKKLYDEAYALYDSAMNNWQKENKRFIFFRNYDEVARFAELSATKAEESIESSNSNTSALKAKLDNKIDSLNNLAGHINRIFRAYPLSSEVWNRISKGKLLLKEAEIAYKRGEYLHADKTISDSEYLLTASYENAAIHLQEYFSAFPVWQKWVENSVRESRQNKSYAIIIDKYSRRCIVYFNGLKKHEYEIELGRNWVGHKRVNGDMATPEGMYRVTKKIGPNNTKYHKALLLDYPNPSDLETFKKEIAAGRLPASAKIGGLIEIHGSGGKGIDWTEGCVALSDSDMDAVYKIAGVGTRVTIVGSLTGIQQILK